MSSFPRGSARVVFLSSAGVVADGSTDNSTRLQAILDLAQAGPLLVVHDMPGTVLADGLLVWSDTTIETLAGGVWKKKGYGGTTAFRAGAMFRNRHVVAGGTAPTDSNIHFRGGYFDGNRRGFSTGGTTAYWTARGVQAGQDYSYIAYLANDNDEVVPMIGFYGVSGCSARDLDFYDIATYGLHYGNVDYAFAENITKTLRPNDAVFGDNLIQLEGYCSGFRIAGVRGQSNDDLVAFNANDGQDIYPSGSPITFIPGIVSGPIRDVHISDLAHTGGAGTLLRLLNANTAISNIIIEDFRVEPTSSSVQACIYFDSFGISGTSTYDDILIRGVRGVVPNTGLVRLQNGNATIRNLVIDGVSGRGGNNALVKMTAGAVSQLLLTNCSTHDNPYLFEITGGSVADLARGPYTAAGLTTDIHDTGSRISTIRRS
jgi:hypothetical protein